MAKKQNWKCGNLKCNKYLNWSQISKIAVDHCHTTGKVRELLCNGCNTTLGHLEIESERLDGLYEYMERHKITK
jgi:predicted class III extradiol MEMO1 family dioxygenase